MNKPSLTNLCFFRPPWHLDLSYASPTQEPPPSPFWQLTRTMVCVSPGRKLGPWSEFPFFFCRFTVLLNSGGSNPWSPFWSEFPHFMGMGVVPAPSNASLNKEVATSLSYVMEFGDYGAQWGTWPRSLKPFRDIKSRRARS